MNEIMQGAAAAEAGMSADDRRLHGVADLAGAVESAMTIVGVLVVAAGLVLVLMGTATVDGGYLDPDVTYDMRSPGISFIGVGVLCALPGVIFA